MKAASAPGDRLPQCSRTGLKRDHVWPATRLRIAREFGGLWCDQGKRTEARDLLAPIYGWFTEGFDTPELQDAKARLDELA